MYDKDKDSFTLLVRDLTTGLLLNRPRADRVAALSWAMNGRALLYTVVNDDKRPYRSVHLLIIHIRCIFFITSRTGISCILCSTQDFFF